MSLLSWLCSFRFSRTSRSARRRRFVRRPARPSRVRLQVESLEDRVVMSASMVADLNAYTIGSSPSNITSAAGSTFFTATNNSGNVELFKTDGTASGTVQLTSGNQIYNFSNLTSFNSKLFFEAYDSARGIYDLWTSDGTVAGTASFLAGGTNVNLVPYYYVPMTVAGTKLYFQASDSSNGLNDLWVSDGTSAGTHPVQPGNSTTPSNISNFMNISGKFFFVNYNGSSGNYELWTSNGTASGTTLLHTFGGNQPGNFTNVNGSLYFTNLNSSGNYELWTSNGTVSGTTLLHTFDTNQPFSLTAVGSTLYFEEYDATNSLYALWKSNGTISGTTMVGDVGTTGNQFYNLTALGSKLFFQVYDTTDAPDTDFALWTSSGTTVSPFTYGGTANKHVEVYPYNSPMFAFSSNLYFTGWDSTNGYALWKSDGSSTTSNTGVLLSSSSAPVTGQSTFTVNGTKLYFLAQTPADGNNNDLWSTTGTSASTAPVQTGGFGRNIYYLTASGSKMFFQANDVDANNNSPHGAELWVSDGTNAGTGMVTDINTTTYGSNPYNPNNSSRPLVTDGNEVFFDASTYVPVNGTYLWQSDGTAANTLPVQTSTGVLPTSVENVTPVGSTVFFTAYGSNGYDLWTTGTGTKSAVEIFASSSSNPFNNSFATGDGTSFANLNGKLYFGAYDAANSQWALWKSDGTAAGTTVVADIDPSYQLYNLTAVGSNLFFENYDSTNGTYALWEYNSTTNTASLVKDISTYGITNLTAVGSNVFFQAYDPTTSEYALWVSNGTTTTNLMESTNGEALYNLTAFNNLLYFTAYNASPGQWQMWTSDGTSAHTTPFLSGNGQPVLVYPYYYYYYSNNDAFTIVGNKLYYLNANDQLGVTDGTATGTGDVQAGASPGTTIAQNVGWLANDNGTLVFQAYDPAHGYELWQSDGTATGTMLADDIVPGTNSSSPTYLAVAGNQVFFNADDGIHGQELWTATLGQTVVTAGLSGPTDGVTEQHRPFVLTANDSNSGNNSAGFSFNINWGDGTSETLSGQSGLTADHQYASVGNFTVSVTATNLADGVTSAAVSQVENITRTEIQNGDLAIGGVAGNNAWSITKGSATGNFTVKINGTTYVTNYTKPPAGEHVFLYSGNGTNSISFDDAAVTSVDTFTISSGFVIFNTATFVSQSPITGWTINGSNAVDTYTINGTLTATINAGSKNDSFKIASGANLLGTINGGNGTNTLDYTSYTTSGVIVDLPLELATGINGGASNGISNIQNITGSGHGNDILVGDSHVNVIKSLKGHNILIGGSGGGDTLTSGGSGDILIAGTTNYDSNLTALQSIEGQWSPVTASTYSTVIGNISSSSATYPLNGSTVTDSGTTDLADTLNGKSGHTTVADWYFAHTSGGTDPNDTMNNKLSSETVTSI